MNTCPTELVTRIVEYACSSDFGQTARNIGLASKYLRSIAEPIEIRTISISGLEQLQGAISRLQLVTTSSETTPNARIIPVRHLFICELTLDAADTCRQRGNYWSATSEGSQAEATNQRTGRKFWELATFLVQSTSASLRTLSLSTSENWCMLISNHIHAKALDAISGTTFPNLTSLTLMHNASSAMIASAYSGSSFRAPTIPRLRRLHITSSMLMGQGTMFPRSHPLFAILRGECSELTQLVICDARFWTSEQALTGVFGEDWRTSLSGRTLPGRLKSVILRHGYVQRVPRARGYFILEQMMERFVNTIAELNVSGLEARVPPSVVAESGKGEYEYLLEDWKEQCLANP